MIGMLVRREADLAVDEITITGTRPPFGCMNLTAKLFSTFIRSASKLWNNFVFLPSYQMKSMKIRVEIIIVGVTRIDGDSFQGWTLFG